MALSQTLLQHRKLPKLSFKITLFSIYMTNLKNNTFPPSHIIICTFCPHKNNWLLADIEEFKLIIWLWKVENHNPRTSILKSLLTKLHVRDWWRSTRDLWVAVWDHPKWKWVSLSSAMKHQKLQSLNLENGGGSIDEYTWSTKWSFQCTHDML